MPLPDATVERTKLHTRTIVCEGYERADGMFDIDGWITDIKTYSFPNHDRGEIKAGEPLHGMGIRLTVDQTFTIRDAVAVTDFSPFRICPNVTPNFKRLIDVRLVAGFNMTAKRLLAGTEGCTHLIDLLNPMATTAFQTIMGKKIGQRKPPAPGESQPRPALLNSCYGWDSSGAMVERQFPEHFTGTKVRREP